MNTNQFIRVTKKFTFDMAHALYGYDGPCKNIHGHTYTLYITLKGKVINDLNNPKNGMVIDFTDFKSIVKTTIIDEFDHSLVLNSLSPHHNLTELKATFEKINFLPFQPSCENLVLDFLNRLKNKFPTNISIKCIKLYETPTSYAEWFEEDNNI
ncbi:MAG: 6-carboxytetrahydropterin synthase [Bacteroidetes bacterium]|nr:6-carboxytetrahydropterin synthase [Bacteroidota bacterium]